jgi:hypothetical protein
MHRPADSPNRIRARLPNTGVRFLVRDVTVALDHSVFAQRSKRSPR